MNEEMCELERSMQVLWCNNSTGIRRDNMLRAMAKYNIPAPPQGSHSIWEHTEILADIVWAEILKRRVPVHIL